MRTKIFAAALALIALSARAIAQAGPEFQVNTTTTGAQRVPVVAAIPSGNFVVAWASFSITAGTDYDIFFQRFDNTGAKIGSETQVNTYTPLNQSQPSIASDSAGNFVVVWTDFNGEDGSNSGVFARRYDSSGNPLGGELQVNTYTAGYQQRPAVAMTAAGNFVVVWQSYPGQDGNGVGVFGRSYDNTGNPLGGEFQVNTYTTNDQKTPRVAVDSTGNFTAVWNSVGQDGGGGGIDARRYDSAGNPLGAEFQVNTYTASGQYLPDVALDPSGNAIFAWTSYNQDGASGGIFARRFDSAGNPLSGELNVNTFTPLTQNRPRVAAGPSGEFVVVWESYGEDDPADVSGSGVFGQVFDNTGKRLGGELLLNNYTTDHQQLPSIAADGRGQFVFAWESQGQDLDGYAVEARMGGFPRARPMKVDERASGGSSNLNGVLESGERVTVDPAYANLSTSPLALSGTAFNLRGPGGPIYTLNDSSADYGSIASGGTNNCFDATVNCYEVTVSGTRPAAHWDAKFDEALSYAGFFNTWILHIGESFPDVPQANLFYRFIENLFHNGVTGGCAGGNYCPSNPVTRAQMAVFLLKARFGSGYVPPAATGTVFGDVPASDPFAPWIENLAALAITGGCGGGNYCPGATVTRKQMAVFLLKTLLGSSYTPPPAAGIFGDVPASDPFAPWIEDLYARGITGGCQASPLLYCPNNPNNRGQMAVFLVKTFLLQLYGA